MAQPTPSVRVCRKCGECKPVGKFYRHRISECRSCTRARVHAWQRANKDRRNAGQRARYSSYRDHAIAHYKADRLKRRGYWMVAGVRRRAKIRGLKFDLDPAEIQRRVDAGVCEISGLPFDLHTNKGWNSPSLDQIVPKGGYTSDNVRVVLFGLNAMMGNWGIETAMKMARAVALRRISAAHGLEAA